MKFALPNVKSLSKLSYGRHINPYRDWLVLIGIALALFLVSTLWNGWLFYRIYNGEALQTTTTTATPAVSTESLTKAEAVFQKRATEATRYRTEYRFVDPSK